MILEPKKDTLWCLIKKLYTQSSTLVPKSSTTVISLKKGCVSGKTFKANCTQNTDSSQTEKLTMCLLPLDAILQDNFTSNFETINVKFVFLQF